MYNYPNNVAIETSCFQTKTISNFEIENKHKG